MLSTDDRDLIGRDPALPGLSVVLDPETMLDLIGYVVDEAVTVEATYVRYKPSTSCVVGYRVTTPGDCRFMFAKAVRPQDREKLAKAVAKATDRRLDAAVSVTACWDQSVYLADAYQDRDLPALRALGRPEHHGRLLARLFPEDERAWSAPIRAIRHKPERRWIGVVDIDGAPTYRIKTYRPSDVHRAHAGQSVLGSSDARPIGWSRRHGAVGSAWIDGQSMTELLGDGERVDAAGVGAALAEIHRRPPSKRLHSVRASDSRQEFRRAADAVTALVPDLAATATRVARRAGRGLPTDFEPGLVHGDFSADQVVVAGRRIHVIDFDESTNGDPSIDLASFRADLTCAEIDGTLTVGSGAAVFDELLDGYRHAGGDTVDLDLRHHLAGAMLRRAVLPFRERRQGWTAKCEEIVSAASAALGERQVGGWT